VVIGGFVSVRVIMYDAGFISRVHVRLYQCMAALFGWLTDESMGKRKYHMVGCEMCAAGCILVVTQIMHVR
jgi:hypothetical protein